MEGYRGFGRNRQRLHSRAVRRSGGVGLLVREAVLKCCEVEVLDTDVEDGVTGEAESRQWRGFDPGSVLHPTRVLKLRGWSRGNLTAAGRTGGEIWIIGPTHN